MYVGHDDYIKDILRIQEDVELPSSMQFLVRVRTIPMPRAEAAIAGASSLLAFTCKVHEN